MAIIYLQDPITGRNVMAESSLGEGGGWKIQISGYSFVYGRLKDNPHALVGMIFRDTNKELLDKTGTPKFIRITQAAHRWVKSKKITELPFLEYIGVKWTPVESTLDAIEQIEAHRQKLEGDFKEEPSETDQGS